tara:strand:- start:552 stop:1424 length:873 start_codon:yes stop_codon:yes gene_type:complete
MKFIKKAWLNIAGGADYFRSRFTDLTAMVGGTFFGAFIGVIVGGLLGALVSEVMSEKKAYVEEHQELSEINMSGLNFIASFPSSCDIDADYAFVQKGPNGNYTLYTRGAGHYKAQSKRDMARFAEDLNDCIDEAQNDAAVLEGFGASTAYQISQPFRAVDLHDDDKDENFRVVSSTSETDDISWPGFIKNMGLDESKAAQLLRQQWQNVINDFSDGKVYDHINAKDVSTFEYEDDYAPYYYEVPIYGALALSCVFGLGAGFGGTPNNAARERKKNRDACRRALDANPLDF